MKRVLVILLLILTVALFVIVVRWELDKKQKANLFTDVVDSVKKESGLIELPGELINEREGYESGSGCHNDWKTHSLRCKTIYIKYYAVGNNVYDEFNKVDGYLRSLGWESDGDGFMMGSLESYNRMYKLGYRPFKIYRKDTTFYPELQLTFLGEKDKSTYDSDYSKKVNMLIEKYSKEYPSLYKITISTDFVEQNYFR